MRSMCERGLLISGELVIALLLAATGAHAAPAPTPRDAPSAEDADDKIENEGPDRIVDRMRWFHEGRLGADREIPIRARERALTQIEKNIRAGILGRDPSKAIAGDGWSAIGPSPVYDGASSFSGRVTAIAVHPTDPNIAYIGAAQGGVWKTTDHGTTWTALTDTQASLSMGALAIDPSNPNVVYAGTGEPNLSCDSYFGAGILKTVDGGATWTRIGVTPFANTSISKIIVDPTNPNIVWAANTVGLGGFVCYGTNAAVSVGVWKSIDAGVTWTRVLSSTETTVDAHTFDMVINSLNTNVLYAAVYHSGIWKTTNGGTSWVRLSGGLPGAASIGRGAIAIHPTNPTILYAVFENFNFGTHYNTYRSTNSGTNWTVLPKPSGSCQYWSFQDICTYSGGGSGQCWYDLLIAVAPDGGVWIGGTGLWRSGTSGSSWSSVCPFYVHADQHAIAFRGSDVWLGNDGGVFTTSNNGAGWTSCNQGLTLTQFYPGAALHPTNASVALGGAQDNGMLWYGGSPGWTLLLTGDGAFNAFDLATPDSVFYVSYQYLNILKYNNGSWISATGGLTDANTSNSAFIAPFAMCPSNREILIAGSDNIWRTTNGAASWSANSPTLDPFDPGARITAVAFSPGGCGTYFAGNNWGRLYRGTEDGAVWLDVTGGLPGRGINDIATHPGDASVVVVGLSGFGGSHVYRTANALDEFPTWTAIDAGIPDTPVNAVLFDPDDPNVLYLGTDVGIFRSTNAGATWQTFMGGHPNVAVYDLVANATTGTIHSYTHGRGVFKLGTFCNDQNACTADSFDQILGCAHASISCEDSNLCTADACDAGTGCSHTSTICPALDACHGVGTCDPQTGACSNPAAPDGTGCSDGDACTQTDACLGGSCTGSNPVTCSPLDPCHEVGTCNPQTGACSNPVAPEGTACSDGDPCTAGDACSGGACVGAPAPAPGEVDAGVQLSGHDVTSILWNATAGATTYDLVRGELSNLPVGPGGGEETCFEGIADISTTDSTSPPIDTGFWYLVRGENACGHGPLGFQGDHGAPSVPRVTTTCP